MGLNDVFEGLKESDVNSVDGAKMPDGVINLYDLNERMSAFKVIQKSLKIMDVQQLDMVLKYFDSLDGEKDGKIEIRRIKELAEELGEKCSSPKEVIDFIKAQAV